MSKKFFEEMRLERGRQQEIGWEDEHNTAGAWTAYIVNYVSRWAMPLSFSSAKYTFKTCMIKAATLCMAAYEWAESQEEETDSKTASEAVTT